MYDFLIPSVKKPKKNVIQIYPKFNIGRNKDLMVRGGDFYAVWDEDSGLWVTDETDVISTIDTELKHYAHEYSMSEEDVQVLYMWDSDSGSIDRWHKYVQKQARDSYHQLDETVIFANTETKKEDYASKKLPYSLDNGDMSGYQKLTEVLYDPEELEKIEWAIGSIIAGDSKRIQKFIVLYGEAGSGKSTILNIIQMLFEGYYTFFSAGDLGSKNNSFALEAFKTNPLVGIEHDSDLSRISDNTKINSIVSHETMVVNEKFKSSYNAKFNAFLFIGTNRPVKITEAKSGLLRRLIDVRPSGKKVPFKQYKKLMEQIPFELGAIAQHCLSVYRRLGDDYYDNYIPLEMMSATNTFYSFIETYISEFTKSPNISLKEVWGLYKKYCEYANVSNPMNMQDVKTELKNYYEKYSTDTIVQGRHIRNYYIGFKEYKFGEIVNTSSIVEVEEEDWLDFQKGVVSRLETAYPDAPAQYASDKGTPLQKWDEVTTTLSEIKTNKLHYVKIPVYHIVIDFDLKDESGKKSLERNKEAARKWPKTYAELSKSGQGIHLHYLYSGDVSKLSRLYAEDIEIKVFTGNSSLRRKLTKCNKERISSINSGLPLKGGKPVINLESVKNEKAIRALIKKNLRKEVHPATKPSVDFIYKILEEAYNDGVKYDVSDLRPKVMAFAANSSHQSDYCLKLVNKMHFASEEPTEELEATEDDLIFFDVEVYPNLFIVVWKKEGDYVPVKMINPGAMDIEKLLNFKLVGFNCRRYDNHILYARVMGYDNKQLYNLSQKIINGSSNALFGEAYNLSYTDVYDFSSKKQSLKKFEIELGIHHMEMGLKWDEPVDEKDWDRVADYCVNDVLATEAVFNARKDDFVAREILADIAGMNVNATTNSLTTRIIFGKERHPELEYTDLSKEFPGYEYDQGKNIYKGYDVGFGGLVMANPGMYSNLITLDVASMHPTSIIEMNMFGEYTKNFKALMDARLYIKHGDYDAAKKLFDGKLEPYLTSKENAKALSQALKIAINSVYGLTAANFDNPFRDPRNKNNIVALRGALMMYDLYNLVTEKGYQVVHIKTDSIKIANYDDEIVKFVEAYGKTLGYTFEIEAKWEKLCLVNNAVFVGKQTEDSPDKPSKWTAVGDQFKVPYVFKTLFSHEPIEFKDKCETKTVMTAMYLDMNEDKKEGEHDYYFVGKAGSFCPIKEGKGGGILVREKGEDLYNKQMKAWEKTKKTKPAPEKYTAVGGTKGFRWLEAEVVDNLNKEEDIDEKYYRILVDDAVAKISEFGDFEWFISDDN